MLYPRLQFTNLIERSQKKELLLLYKKNQKLHKKNELSLQQKCSLKPSPTHLYFTLYLYLESKIENEHSNTAPDHPLFFIYREVNSSTPNLEN